ncbi:MULTISPECIES: glutaredoxin domain-containing protein [Peribacillus]|uniref:Glutaredoxin n=1 Tax=Peribacillus asahii TaxID=228899 RepID=A0A398BJI2_9BACI|nr:glutaredoxin domain-containing protein [Peribacillus asahii]AZV42085.1 glutaredoxin [Peribacillus asahii]RID87616.1 NrdH-redoxin [Peribacillus asahii]USK61041.1 glutathione S-transferase N-terminal domain-containing protein [Peribacillus asahii]USK71471.1 glutathione S-transferase N-terminal domain-containing protein [Peribacillus asahii]USK86408.1 glutathione S-transferase N-terminal domain-containing protein [Peribacillus asahii]
MKDVTLYTQPDCPPCQIMKLFFNDNNISYKEKNIKTDKTALQELTKKYGSYSTPTVVIDGKAIIGFELEEIKKELQLD